ncbi:MAG: hypothetical protein AAFX99_32115, partial [Myxococcota bacterium]
MTVCALGVEKRLYLAGFDQRRRKTIERHRVERKPCSSNPLYSFSNDVAPGDTNGEGVGGTWFTLDP